MTLRIPSPAIVRVLTYMGWNRGSQTVLHPVMPKPALACTTWTPQICCFKLLSDKEQPVAMPC